ncbi:CubicO group peptidase (beta-lactamase class C family) [Chryseobacterium defluvii]|uniref:CubicO group peptidase (Beta-lactamase class C family) n=1 Tax=Chryseobacterium defluvii TaxID=160396 RepID=A0A840KB94_9FLAO|nr:serine hydrolase domain-containing protein [Chryseobacterium defluvii]MBB4805084.1 CubicO group peptidase (beta-lactamase class C family) [Chryseobacterium defluvii]
MKFISGLLYTLLILFSVSCFNGQSKDNYTSKIDSLIKVKTPRTFNGVVVITKDGKSKYSKAYGFKNSQTKIPLNVDDQFEIMSNTKQITSVLILKEVEKGKIDLQSSIKKYLPFLSQTWADTVTVHQLLNHTHGIEAIEKPLLFTPGSEFKYGNLSNILLGKILENVSGKTYTQLANELFRQLNMRDTFCYSKDNRRNLVSGHMSNNSHFTVVENSFINDENMPADGVVTTAKDLVIWNSKLHKGKILKPRTYALMTTSSVLSQHDVFGKEKMGYGYNIRIVKDPRAEYLGHSGLGDGFASLNIYIPKDDVSIIVLENQMNENSDLYYYFETKIKDIILNSNLVKN